MVLLRKGGSSTTFNETLILKRSKDGKWCFPGGKAEYLKSEKRLESYAEAAVRECREETGHQVYFFGELELATFGISLINTHYSDTNYIGKFFMSTHFTKKDKVKFPNREHTEKKWVKIKDLQSYFDPKDNVIGSIIANILNF